MVIQEALVYGTKRTEKLGILGAIYEFMT